MGAQKNCLNETVLFEHPKQMFKLMDKKIITLLHSTFLFYLDLCGLVRYCILTELVDSSMLLQELLTNFCCEAVNASASSLLNTYK